MLRALFPRASGPCSHHAGPSAHTGHSPSEFALSLLRRLPPSVRSFPSTHYRRHNTDPRPLSHPATAPVLCSRVCDLEKILESIMMCTVDFCDCLGPVLVAFVLTAP